jgi:hypothetical protein
MHERTFFNVVFSEHAWAATGHHAENTVESLGTNQIKNEFTSRMIGTFSYIICSFMTPSPPQHAHLSLVVSLQLLFNPLYFLRKLVVAQHEFRVSADR